MNLSALAIMVAIGVGFIGLLAYALIGGHPLLLAALAVSFGVAFAPWHRW